MEVNVTRDTGFYGMGSPITLRVDDWKISLGQNQSVTLDVDAPFQMQVTFFWLKSPVYTIAEPTKNYRITMNLLLLQLYPVLFLFTGISAIAIQSILYSLLIVVVMIGFFLFIKNKAYVIKEASDEEF
ncbi:hypothetical protein QJ527_11025 [Enterococcus mundtii]|uniref:hypothetical protein n=1 Tax=Enterococcus TaxID=1350 RepID=UPI00044BB466|nr:MULTISPECIES: hypothetical protein [Enterococcus]EYT96120.1 hypothetical protein AK89_04585 [Enterococcus mundtii CRL35]MDA9428993.1 hypothetical protein [Enterococcus mundtii 1A]MDK4212065.1 hypothetical protein [Enterococcus mundtii]MDO7879627.1 hypothetical protein [Enterococcus mundtii]MEC3940031.1 hypothetical protein [Enterococcus mundtii]